VLYVLRTFKAPYMLLTVEITYNIMMSWKISPLLSEIKDIEHHITQLETSLCISNGPF